MYKRILGIKKIAITIILTIFALVIIYINTEKLSFESGIVVSVITFIYGFFLNSIFKFTETKYTTFKLHVGNLISNLQSLYCIINLSKQRKIVAQFQKEIISFIDLFLKTRPDNYEKTQDKISSMYALLKNFKITSENDKNIHNRSISTLQILSNNREQLEIFGDKYLVGEMKQVYIAFTGLMIGVLFLIGVENMAMLVISGVLIIALIFLTQLIFDLDSLDYGQYMVSVKNLQDLKKEIQK